MNKRFYLSGVLGFILVGCMGVEKASEIQKKDESKSQMSIIFSAEDAKRNLSFSKDQYVKLINNIADNKNLHFSKVCTEDKLLCFPRSEEEDAIYMEKPKKWTNGFYPGLLWKLLSSKNSLSDFTDEQETLLKNTARVYQEALISESKRGTTHDLGFILYDSFGEALEYSGLDDEDRTLYQQTLNIGRETLSTRFSHEKGVIKSWDALPRYTTQYKENGQTIKGSFDVSAPWTYPVIVDNMMNLDFLFSDNTEKYNRIAFEHAQKTANNHYYYLENDVNKERPISYHLIDYGNMKPGNWQGLGAISAWARGQAWSLYGFVTVVEAAQKVNQNSKQTAEFEQHLDSLFKSVNYLLKDDYVPLWDFLATREDAYVLAENLDDSNTVYSKILDLCAHQIPSDTLPYVGYRPMALNSSLFKDNAISKLKTVTTIDDEAFIKGDKIYPCGTKPYDLAGREIPRDTSAAAIMASALYRLALFTENEAKRNEYTALADNIMAKLTRDYLTNKDKSVAYDLGFVMTNATGNLPSASEINTSILYADFFFVEANIRKLALSDKFTAH